MKIIHVIDSLDVGGAEKMCIQLASLFAHRNHSVGILYFRDTTHNFLKSVDRHVVVHKIDKKLWDPLFYRKVAQLLSGYDIVHVHLKSTLKVVYLADKLFSIRSKIVFHDHTGSKKLFYETANDFILKKAILKYIYVAVHDELKEMTAANMSKKNPIMSVVANYVPKPPTSSLKVKTKDEHECIDMLLLGNIKEQKNQLFLVAIGAELNKLGKKFRFHVCGKIHDENYNQSLHDAVSSAKLHDAFIFYEQYTEFWQIPLSVDMALMVSKDESGPLVNIEYLLLKVPFLTHNVGYVTKLIKNDLPDCVVDSLNEKEWANRIINTHTEGIDVNKFNHVYERYFSENHAYNCWLNVYLS